MTSYRSSPALTPVRMERPRTTGKSVGTIVNRFASCPRSRCMPRKPLPLRDSAARDKLALNRSTRSTWIRGGEFQSFSAKGESRGFASHRFRSFGSGGAHYWRSSSAPVITDLPFTGGAVSGFWKKGSIKEQAPPTINPTHDLLQVCGCEFIFTGL